MTPAVAFAVVLALVVSDIADAHYYGGCKTRSCKRHVVAPYDAKLKRMAWCESRRRWHLDTGNGYYGGLQFSLRTWRSVGGRGFPHTKRPVAQKYRAVVLIQSQGYRPWPVCGSA